MRLTVPDQNVNITNVGSVLVRLRDAGSDSQWTDAGGRRAFIDGAVVTEYTAGSIRFLGGQHQLAALQQTSLRPDPAQWDPATTNYSGTGTAPAAFGARARGTYLFLTFDIAYMAFRDVSFDLASPVLPITSGSFPGGDTQFGISSAVADVDGLVLPLGLGQPVPDIFHAQVSNMVETNTVGGTVLDLGGRNRKLTCNIDTPVNMELDAAVLAGRANGQIVAYATLPEAPALRIAAAGPEKILLAWPAAATGFALERSLSLLEPIWQPVGGSPALVGGEWQVTVSAGDPAAFYRLRW